LIAACLTPDEINSLGHEAKRLGLEVLLEVHDEEELDQCLAIEQLPQIVDLIGVNNRSLKTFVTSVETSLRLADRIPDSFVKVAESGLSSATTLHVLREAGFEGFLIGEAFMKTSAPAAALAALVTDSLMQTSS
jgi:indole-3-glycerol phosphate synthase